MGTLPPQKLLDAWKLEQLTPEMAVGHLLQHLVMLSESDQEASQKRAAIYTAIDALNIGWANVKLELTELRRTVEVMQQQIANLREHGSIRKRANGKGRDKMKVTETTQ